MRAETRSVWLDPMCGIRYAINKPLWRGKFLSGLLQCCLFPQWHPQSPQPWLQRTDADSFLSAKKSTVSDLDLREPGEPAKRGRSLGGEGWVLLESWVWKHKSASHLPHEESHRGSCGHATSQLAGRKELREGWELSASTAGRPLTAQGENK